MRTVWTRGAIGTSTSPSGRAVRRWRSRLGGPVGRAVLTFAISGLIALLVAGFGVALAFRAVGKSEAVKEARTTTDLVAAGVVTPTLTDDLLAGDPRAVASFDQLVRQRILGGGRIIRVKLWRSDGTIVYSDEPRLIGRSFTLGEDDVEILRDGGSAASVSDLSAPENLFEQPDTVRNTMRGHLLEEEGTARVTGLNLSDDDIKRINRIVITACGTSWHSALIGEYMLEELARIPVEVEYASEFRYRNPVVDGRTLVIAISQSGETADTLAAVREAKRRGARTLGIVNSVGSTIAREVDGGIYLHAGPEIGARRIPPSGPRHSRSRGTFAGRG